MRIGMILDAPFPPDIRVEKEAKSLHKAGHEVYIFSQHRKSYPVVEKGDNYLIVRFDTNRYKTLKQLTRDFRKIAFYDPVWVRGINDFVKTHQIDALHVHDLPLVKTALKVSQKNSIPIVADYHENFPAHIKGVSDSKLSLKDRFYRSYKRWAKYEESISHKVDRIIVVAEEYKRHLIVEHDVPEDKITIVQNTVDTSKFQFNKDINRILKSSSEFVISYIGSYGPHRGLDVVIKAMPEILSHISGARFVVIGKGKNKKELESLAQRINIENSVLFVDWMDYENLTKEFRKADIGVIPHHPSEHTETTIPNKLFEYMYFKVPVITSDLTPLKRIIEETRAGKVFKSGNCEDFAKKVLEIFDNPDNYGEKGNRAVIEKYNWDIDGDRLVRLYESFNQ